jgi:hypothetical protein
MPSYLIRFSAKLHYSSQISILVLITDVVAYDLHVTTLNQMSDTQ